MLEILKTKEGLQKSINKEKDGRINDKVIFVPTMGNLHEGHLSLIKFACDFGGIVVVSIFINPKQFGKNEDLSTYPRTLAQDINSIESLLKDGYKRSRVLVYTPTEEEIYPNEVLTEIKIPKLMNCLCGISRPQFFGGILCVIARLFSYIKPDVAIFGRKDYQQFLIIKQFVQDFAIDVRVLSHRIIREENGLAMSSRNGKMTKEERKSMGIIYKTLSDTNKLILNSKSLDRVNNIILDSKRILKENFINVDYFELRDKNDLSLINNIDFIENKNAMLFFGGYFKEIRLIDNIEIM
jgi:pantoate--beta-alanine ligase